LRRGRVNQGARTQAKESSENDVKPLIRSRLRSGYPKPAKKTLANENESQ
jgi:hypothetical protein